MLLSQDQASAWIDAQSLDGRQQVAGGHCRYESRCSGLEERHVNAHIDALLDRGGMRVIRSRGHSAKDHGPDVVQKRVGLGTLADSSRDANVARPTASRCVIARRRWLRTCDW